jgi:hypothetical protein
MLQLLPSACSLHDSCLVCFFLYQSVCTAVRVQTVGEARRAEALAAILAKQAGAAASIKEAAERRRAAEADRLAQLADKQRRKQEAQVRGPCL